MARTPETANQRRARGAAHKQLMRRAMVRQNDRPTSPSRRQRQHARAREIQREHAEAGQHCPHPDKRAYVTKDEAQEALWHSWRSADGKVKPVRVYKCACGCWHLTAQAWAPEHYWD